jgi:putative serine protease PepD
MTDQNDPFADRPYTPPAQRGPGDTPTPGAEGASAAGQQGPEQGSVPQQPAPYQQPAQSQPTQPQQPAQNPGGQPTVEQPAASQAPPPPAAAPQPPTSQQGEQPAATVPPEYQHRYEAPAPPQGPSGHEPTVVMPGGAGAPPAFTAQPPVAEKPRRRPSRTVAGVAAIALLAASAGAGGAALYDVFGAGDSSTSPVVSSLDSSTTDAQATSGQVEKVAKAVLPSVVQINVTGGQEAGSGTGIIISSDGDILTNNHVVEAAAEQGTITVAFSDGTTTPATIVGRDPKTDLAVIKVDKNGLTPATFGKSSDLAVGEEVIAIGSPFGLESTVTSGIVSALNRPVSSSDGTGQNTTVFPAVQTDAAINPGNSGGPLVDLSGRVVGINSAIRSGGTTSASAGSIGLGFAIPIDLAKSVADQLVKGEKVQHALIGVTVRPAVSSDDITGIGAEITEVADGSAGAKAGLEPGDIVTAINGQPVSSSDALVAGIRGYRPGEKVTLTYLRDGKKNEAQVTLDSDGGNTTD